MRLITAGGAYAVALLRRETAKIQQQIDNETASKYMDMAADAVAQAVTYTAQTFTDALKAEGKFTKEKQIEAFNKAKDKTLEILGDAAVNALGEIYGDFDVRRIETQKEARRVKHPPSLFRCSGSLCEALRAFYSAVASGAAAGTASAAICCTAVAAIVVATLAAVAAATKKARRVFYPPGLFLRLNAPYSTVCPIASSDSLIWVRFSFVASSSAFSAPRYTYFTACSISMPRL